MAKGAEANGYATDLWTLKRVVEVIERVTGVTYHPARVWYILRQGLNWTWQRPARRATERNDEAIQRWVYVVPNWRYPGAWQTSFCSVDTHNAGSDYWLDSPGLHASCPDVVVSKLSTPYIL